MRFIKKTVILAKVETTAGTDAVPTGAANAIQAFDVSITPVDAQLVPIDVITPWFGGAINLVATSCVKCSFSVLLGGAGLAATGTAWGQLLLGCGVAETTGLTVPNRVEYTLITDLMKTLTIYWYDDGLLHKMLGAFGNVKLSAKRGDAPKLMFDFIGVDGTPSATANATAVLTAWKIPPTIAKANVTDIQLGCTYSAGALTGGTLYNSSGIDLDFGNVVNFAPLLNQEQVILSDRSLKGSIELDLTAGQEVTQIANVKANAVTGMGFEIGNTSGNKIMLHMPSVQLLSPKKVNFNGMRLIGFDIEPTPVTGNDELRLISL